MKTTRKFLAAVLTKSPRRELETLKMDLAILVKGISPILREYDKAKALVHFYNITSSWRDRDWDHLISKLNKRNWLGQHDSLIEELQRLKLLFGFSEDDLPSWRRTMSDEPATEDNVYVGSLWGMEISQVSALRSRGNKFENPFGFPKLVRHVNKSEFNVISEYQIYPFLQEKCRDIIVAVYAVNRLMSK